MISLTISEAGPVSGRDGVGSLVSDGPERAPGEDVPRQMDLGNCQFSP